MLDEVNDKIFEIGTQKKCISVAHSQLAALLVCKWHQKGTVFYFEHVVPYRSNRNSAISKQRRSHLALSDGIM